MSRDLNQLLQKISGGSSLVFVGNLIGLGATFFTRLIAARYLQPSDYGVIILGLVILNILSLFSLMGLHQGIARELPRKENKVEVLFQSGMTAVLLSIVISGIFLAISSPLVDALSEPELLKIYPLFVAVVPLVVVTRMIVGMSRGLEDTIGKVLLWNIGKQGFVAIGVSVGVVMGVGLFEMTVLWVISLVLAGILSITYLLTSLLSRQDLEYIKSDLLKPRNYFSKSMLIFSVPLMFSGAMRLMMQQADNYLLAFYMSSFEVGVYDSTFTIGRGLFITTSTVGYLFLPIFSNLHNKNRFSEMNRFYKLTTKWMALAILPVYMMMLFYSENILELLFGQKYVAGSLALKIVASGFFFHILMGITGNGLIAIGKTRQIAIGNGIALVINLILNIIIIPKFGIAGAAISSAVAYSLANIYWLLVIYIETGVQPFYRGYLIPLVCGIVLLFVIHEVISDLTLVGYHSIIIEIISAGLLYPILILITGGVEQEERNLLQDLIKKFKSKSQ